MIRKIALCFSVVLACLVMACSQPQFGRAVNLGSPINTTFDENGPFLSADQTRLYFHSGRSGSDSDDIWFAARPDATAAWDEPRLLDDMVNDLFQSYGLTMSDDELTRYFSSNSPALGGAGNYDLWYSTRASPDSPWSFPISFGTMINSPGIESDPRVSRNGLELYFTDLDIPPFRSGGLGGGDIWVSRRSSVADPWGEPENLVAVNSAFTDFTPSLADNDRILFFASNRIGGLGDFDIWISRREDLTAPWGPPQNAGARLNSAYKDSRPYASSDGTTLYYGSYAEGGLGGMDIWQAEIYDIKRLGR